MPDNNPKDSIADIVAALENNSNAIAAIAEHAFFLESATENPNTGALELPDRLHAVHLALLSSFNALGKAQVSLKAALWMFPTE